MARRRQRVALGVLMGLTFLVVAWMAAPLLVGLALGTVMGFTAQPFYFGLSQRLGKRRKLASAVTTLLGGLLVVGGGTAAAWVVARELVAAVAIAQQRIAAGPLNGPWAHPRARPRSASIGMWSSPSFATRSGAPRTSRPRRPGSSCRRPRGRF